MYHGVVWTSRLVVVVLEDAAENLLCSTEHKKWVFDIITGSRMWKKYIKGAYTKQERSHVKQINWHEQRERRECNGNRTLRFKRGKSPGVGPMWKNYAISWLSVPQGSHPLSALSGSQSGLEKKIRLHMLKSIFNFPSWCSISQNAWLIPSWSRASGKCADCEQAGESHLYACFISNVSNFVQLKPYA